MPNSKELTKPSTKPAKTTKSSKKAGAALATCPVNGAGWCPYPFSVEQLERSLKEKAAAAEAATAEKAKRR